MKGVEGRFEKIRTGHPEFKGKTGLMASPYEGYFIYGSQDPRSRLLTDLGFTLPAGYENDWGTLFAALTIAMLPVVVVYLIFYRQVQAGLTSATLK